MYFPAAAPSRVGGGLDLSGTGITSLPEGLTVGGRLDLRGTGITSLAQIQPSAHRQTFRQRRDPGAAQVMATIPPENGFTQTEF